MCTVPSRYDWRTRKKWDLDWSGIRTVVRGRRWVPRFSELPRGPSCISWGLDSSRSTPCLQREAETAWRRRRWVSLSSSSPSWGRARAGNRSTGSNGGRALPHRPCSRGSPGRCCQTAGPQASCSCCRESSWYPEGRGTGRAARRRSSSCQCSGGL